MTNLVDWLRQQLDTDEATALAAKDAFWYTDGHSDEAYAFMDAFKSDFVLRQVQAHRAILDAHRPEEYGAMWCGTCVRAGLDGYPCPTVAALVSIYSDRDGYDPGWTP